MKSFQPATLTPTGEVAPLRKRRKERRRSPGNGLHFSSGCHGPRNGGDKRLIFEQGSSGGILVHNSSGVPEVVMVMHEVRAWFRLLIAYGH